MSNVYKYFFLSHHSYRFCLFIYFLFHFSLISRSAGSCSSSVCRLLDDGGGGGGDKTPPPCWCTAETTATTAAIVGDPNNDALVAAAGRATTGYRCSPHGSLLQRQGTAAAATALGERSLRSRPATAVQSNVQRPSSRIVPPRCVSAGDWCCDSEDVDVDDYDDDDDQDDEDNVYYYDYDENCVDNDVADVRDDNRVRVVVMNNRSSVITGGAVDAQGRGGVAGTDAKPPVVTTSERTYASTEAQTDAMAFPAFPSAYREQRRRERRERRQQQRRVHPPPPPPPALSTASLLPPPPQSAIGALTMPYDLDRLPDLLLNSHLPPPLYTTVGGSGSGGGGGGGVVGVGNGEGGGVDGVLCDMAARVANLQASLLPTVFQHPSQPSVGPVGSSATVNSPGGFRLPFGIIPARRRRSVPYHIICYYRRLSLRTIYSFQQFEIEKRNRQFFLIRTCKIAL